MPNIGHHVDSVFIPESVNTSTTLRINGGDLILNTGDITATAGSVTAVTYYGDGSNLTGISGGGGSGDIVDDTTPQLGGNLDLNSFSITGTGDLNFTGDIHLPDGNKLYLGTGDDLEVYHNAGSNYIDATEGNFYIRTTGGSSVNRNLFIRSNNSLYLSSEGSKNGIVLNAVSGFTEIWNGNNGTKSLETTDNGINVTGGTITGPATLTIDPAAVGDNTGLLVIKGDLQVDGTTTTVNSTTVELNHVSLGDDETANFGDDNDLQIYHTAGTESVIKESGSGPLKLLTNRLEVKSSNDANTMAVFASGANGQELYYDNVKKFETTAEGILLSSTDDGSDAYPEIDLFRDSASPDDGDYLGQIKFTGKQDAGGTVSYAKITGKVLDASQGTEDGILEFMLRKAGSNNIAARFRSDSLQLINGTGLAVDGKIGVGITTPAAQIDVGGTAAAGVPGLDISTYNCNVNDTSDIVLTANGVIRASTTIRNVVNNSGSFLWYIGGTDDKAGVDGSTEVMRLDAQGELGIGTNAPNRMLDVYKAGGDAIIRVNNTGDGNISGIDFYRESSAGTNNGGAAIWIESDTSSSTSPLKFGVANNASSTSMAADMILTAVGNLGIGTETPASKLDVNGEITIRNGAQANGLKTNANGQLQIFRNNVTNNQVVMTIDDETGFIGIGTDAPTEELEIYSATPSMRWKDSDEAGSYGSVSMASPVMYLQANGASSDGQFIFRTGNAETFTERLRVNSSGATVAGTVTATAFSGDGSALTNLPATSNIWSIAGSEIYYTGNVGIGTTNPSNIFQVYHATTNALAMFESGDSTVQVGFKDGNTTNGNYIGAQGDSLIFWTNGFNERGRFDSAGRFLKGHNASIQVGSAAGGMQLHSTTSTNGAMLTITRYNNDGTGGKLTLGKSRNTTVASGSLIQNGDTCGEIEFAGDDGVDLHSRAAGIKGQIDNVPGPNDMPGRLVFSTTANGASTPTERMWIKSDGKVGIGTNVPSGHLTIRSADDVTSIDIMDPSSATHGAHFSFSDTANTAAIGGITAGTRNEVFKWARDSVGFMYFTGNGTAGIGTEAPTRGPLHLHLDAATDCQIHMTNSATGATSSDGMTIFSNDHDCGIWYREDGPIRFAANGSEVVRFTADAEVGIGTSSPSDELHVKGHVRVEAKGTTINNNYSKVYQNSSASVDYGLQLKHYDGSTGNADAGIYIGGSTTSTEGHINFYSTDDTSTNPAVVRMTLEPSGRFGIGTINPQKPFEVRSTGTQARFSYDSTNYGEIQAFSDGRTYFNARAGASSRGSYQFRGYNGTDNQAFLTIDDVGNVGIGTVTPASPLVVHGSGTVARFGDTDNFDVIDVVATGGYPTLSVPSSNDTFQLRGMGSVQVAIDYNDNTADKSFSVVCDGSNSGGNRIFKIGEDGNFSVNQAVPAWTNSTTSQPILLWDYNATYGNNMYIASGGNQTQSNQTAVLVGSDSGVVFGEGGWDGTDALIGSEWARFTRDGRLGIGTNAPGSLLHLSSDNSTIHINTNRDDTNFNNAGILFSTPRSNSTDGSSHGGRGAIINLGSSTSTGGTQWMLAASASLSTNDNDAALKAKQCGLRLDSGGNIEHWASNSLIMRSQGDGNVGIGTAVAGHKLEVQGQVATSEGAAFGRGTLTADGQNDVRFFSTSVTSNVSQSGAFNNKVRILGGGGQTRSLDLYQQYNGGAHIGSSWTSNNLTFDSAFTWVEFDQRVIIDADNQADGALRIVCDQTSPEQDFYFAQEIVTNLTGTTTTTADREQGGIYIDVNSSATGGDTNHEHRAYGVFVDLDVTGDADVAYGGYFDSVVTPSTGTVTAAYGVYGRAEDNGGAGNVTNCYGLYGLAYSDNSNSDPNHLYGVYGKALNAADTGNIGGATGVYAEIEIPAGSGDHYGNCYVMRAEFDNNDTGVSQTNTTYLFFGNYAGDLPTTAYGIYINDDVPSLFRGDIQVGTATDDINIRLDTNGNLDLHGELNMMGSSDSNKYIDARIGTNALNIRKTTGGDTGHETMAKFIGDGAVELYYNNVKKFETSSAGATVTGDFTATGNVTAYSDIKLKSNIEPIPDALEKVTQIRGVTYDRVDSGERQAGVIAQEVEAVLPEVVKDHEGTKTVAYGNMVGLLVEAIKDLKEEVETLKNEIKTLKEERN